MDEQPDGIADDSRDLPDPARAAERVNTFLAWFGDGLMHVDAGAPPLYARDLQALANLVAERDELKSRLDAVHAVLNRPWPDDEDHHDFVNQQVEDARAALPAEVPGG